MQCYLCIYHFHFLPIFSLPVLTFLFTFTVHFFFTFTFQFYLPLLLSTFTFCFWFSYCNTFVCRKMLQRTLDPFNLNAVKLPTFQLYLNFHSQCSLSSPMFYCHLSLSGCAFVFSKSCFWLEIANIADHLVAGEHFNPLLTLFYST